MGKAYACTMPRMVKMAVGGTAKHRKKNKVFPFRR